MTRKQPQTSAASWRVARQSAAGAPHRQLKGAAASVLVVGCLAVVRLVVAIGFQGSHHPKAQAHEVSAAVGEVLDHQPPAAPGSQAEAIETEIKQSAAASGQVPTAAETAALLSRAAEPPEPAPHHDAAVPGQPMTHQDMLDAEMRENLKAQQRLGVGQQP